MNIDTHTLASLFVWVVQHEAHEQATVFVATTDEEALAKAEAFVLEETHEYRDHDEYPDDADWLDLCWSEGWELTMGSIHAG